MNKKGLLSSLCCAMILLSGCNKTTSSSNTTNNSQNSTSISDSSSEVTPVTYEVLKGDYTYKDNIYKSTKYDSMLLLKETMETGSISVSIRVDDVFSDNGIIFNYTEESYYFYGVNFAKEIYLAKNTGGNIKVIKSWKDFPSYEKENNYKLEVYLDKKNNRVEVYANDAYVDVVALDGLTSNRVGFSAGGKNTEYKELKLIENYNLMDNNFDLYAERNGYFEDFTSSSYNAIVTHASKGFVNGEFSADMKLDGSAADNGLVFGIESNDKDRYWENGVSYYFFFTNLAGLAYLGKVTSGRWEALQTRPIYNFDAQGTYNIKVVRSDNKIYCYLDDLLYFTHTDAAALSGVEVGLRAGSKNVEYSNISITSFTTTENTNVSMKTDSYTEFNNIVTATKDNALALANDTLDTGTFETNMHRGNSKNNGVVFNYSKHDDDTESYYYFYINGQNRVCFAKKDHNVVSELPNKFLSNGWSTVRGFKFKVVVKENDFYCYLDDRLAYAYHDDNPLSGNEYGYLAGGVNCSYELPLVTTNVDVEKNETLIFGHSYTEFWYTYKEDFPQFKDINDIGLGGSVAADWNLYADEIINYGMKKGIYWIGINDLTFGVTPQVVYENVKALLLEIKEAIPEFEIALVGVNQCTARLTLVNEIHQTNVLYQSIANEYSWVHYIETEFLYCDSNNNPIASYFTDGLHLTHIAYQMVSELIVAKLNK